MIKSLQIGLSLVAMVAAVAQAQIPGVQRVEGVVAAMSKGSLSITRSDGTTAQVALLPGRTVMVVEPIALDQIQPGSYVATANKSQPDGTGVSIELRVYPPDTTLPMVNRMMNEADQTMMTNGHVAKAVGSNGGRLLTVDYGSGSRQIVVPPSVQAMSNTPGTWEMVKVGRKVSVATFPAAGERPARQTITIAKADLAS